ncbi:MBL fold metallo-hydrolase [Natronococcus sp. A-GB1]|uniref:MBL fold metallo-hydrolase n=1 Tax=Natronococcus sp. A-GB1 TaxID=3037648 RepID=UPI00241DE8E0|nr:MBL fold metallo-hydrolase [Natronococcus sp. A-GB1]MDG5758779.1 MBL fold metallo-hydrolase [Natronococcus sp. A-GB1]
MRVTLLGTGDTTGTPTVGCDCGTCRTARERGLERTRFSVHVENERTDESLLIDFSPDFRSQFLREEVPMPDAGIITHVHFDHLDGLGNAFRVFDSLEVYAADETDPRTGNSVAETVAEDYHYLNTIAVRPTSPLEPTRICGLDVTLVPVDHPPLVCYGLAIEDPETDAKLSITGDTSYAVPDRSREVLAGPDLLLADAIVPAHLCASHPAGGRHEGPDGTPYTFGSKHMTREGALTLAEELEASRTRLVHLAHYYPAEEAFEEPLAVDGERYVLE